VDQGQRCGPKHCIHGSHAGWAQVSNSAKLLCLT
jgi:hypothetical protein